MGDTLALYVVHDTKALEESNDKAYIGKTVYYDHSDSFLSLIRHEALYASYIVTKDFNNIDETEILELSSLNDLPEDIDCYNNLRRCVIFNNEKYTYGICLFNKWCGFNRVKINYMIYKKNNNDLSNLVWEECNGDCELFYRRLNHLEKNLFFYISINNIFPPTINITEMVDLASKMKDLAQKIPDNVDIGYLVNQALVKRSIENFSEHETTLYNLFKSGSRFSEKQLARSNINIGFVADSENKIHPMAFNTNLLKGLNEEEFFASSSGTRKGY
jgi:hypothetical protein